MRKYDIMKSTWYFCGYAETKLTRNTNVRINSVLIPIFISLIPSESSLVKILLSPTKKFNYLRSLTKYLDSENFDINPIGGFDFMKVQS